MAIIDIGANLGYYTAIASHLTGEKGLVVAFEPEPNFFKLLSRNISRNNMKMWLVLNWPLPKKWFNEFVFI